MIRFHTNLDEAKRDVAAIDWRWRPPRVGEDIVFEFDRGGQRLEYSLRVVAVQHRFARDLVEVELHLPPYFRSIAEWTEYMRRRREGLD